MEALTKAYAKAETQLLDLFRSERVALLRAALPPVKRNECIKFTSPVALDLEWDPDRGSLILIGVGNEEIITQIWWQEISETQKQETREWLESLVKTSCVIYHNAIGDVKKLRESGFVVSASGHAGIEDTMLAHAVLQSELEHTLEFLHTNLELPLPEYKSLGFHDLSLRNACDVVCTVQAWRALEAQFAMDPQAHRVYRTLSIPFLDIAITGEERGIAVDQKKALALKAGFEEKISQATRLFNAGAGYEINPGSPDQVKHYLYSLERMPVQRDHEAKATTNKDAIAALRRLHGTEWDPDESPTLTQALYNVESGGHPGLEARYLFMGARQSLSHYVTPCLGVERIYPECRLHVQASGRHSYVDPPLSQFKGEVESLLIPDEGTVWIGHDWSNIETWLLGVLANDPLILLAKLAGYDTHTLNFCDITSTPYPPLLTKSLHTSPDCVKWRAAIKWTGEDDIRRNFAKRFIYRVHYRGQADMAGDIPGARSLGFDAQRLVHASELYLSKHRPILYFWEQSDRISDAEGLVRTFMGRPRRLNNPNRNARYREAANHGLQGGVADIYSSTALLVKQSAPWAHLVYGKFDSQWWQVPKERQFEFAALYTPIVCRDFEIYGRCIDFPASFKIKERP